MAVPPQQRESTMTSPWLAYHKPNPLATVRLFCFPYAGGGAVIYRHWAESLPPEVAVCPVQLTGRGNRSREAPLTRMMPLVELIAQGIESFLDKPFAFFGHSMGATISFELARLLRKRGAPEPRHLFISGRCAPQSPDVETPIYDLPDENFLESIGRLNGTPKEALENLELMQFILPMLRADFEIIQTYKYEGGLPLSCPITVFGGSQDTEVSGMDLEAWGELTTGPFSLQIFPGDHFFLNTHQPDLLRAIVREMNRARFLQACQ